MDGSEINKEKEVMMRYNQIDWNEILDGYNNQYIRMGLKGPFETELEMFEYLYAETGSGVTISELIGVAQETTYKHLKKIGIPINGNKRNRRQKNAYITNAFLEIDPTMMQFMPAVDIAKKLGCTREMIYNLTRKHKRKYLGCRRKNS